MPIESLADVLEGLLYTVPQYYFSGLTELWEKLRDYLHDLSQIMVFHRFPTKELQGLAVLAEDFPRLLTSYYCKEHILVFKMPNKPHEVENRVLTRLIDSELDRMGVSEEVVETGSTTRLTTEWRKESDSSWEPVNFPQYGFNPTFTIEVGLPESASKLALDARGWLESKKSETRLVLTVEIPMTTPLIKMELWVRKEQDPQESPDRLNWLRKGCKQCVSYNGHTRMVCAFAGLTLSLKEVLARDLDVRGRHFLESARTGETRSPHL